MFKVKTQKPCCVFFYQSKNFNNVPLHDTHLSDNAID